MCARLVMLQSPQLVPALVHPQLLAFALLCLPSGLLALLELAQVHRCPLDQMGSHSRSAPGEGWLGESPPKHHARLTKSVHAH